MRKQVIKSILAITMGLALTLGTGYAGEKTQTIKKSAIEVAFVLDTTGSMGGLIEGAKMKIWSIANEMVRAKPAPELKLALVGYRDRRDQYITLVHDLSDDLDTMYGHLKKFEAEGGGDRPESVNQALHEAVTRLSWSGNRDALKIIFLVGDAPPHMDYQDDVKYSDTCRRAVKNDLIINTIQCGNMGDTTPVWKEIARLAEGRFARISQTGNMAAIDTPMDAELETLNREIGKTAVAYGASHERGRMTSKMAISHAAPKATKADRLKFLSRSKKVVTGGGDLVEDMEKGRVKLEEVAPEALPEPVREMEAAERKAYVRNKMEKRKQIQERIDSLLKQRDAYIKKEMIRLGNRDAFDEKVAEIIREQAAKKGMVYERE